MRKPLRSLVKCFILREVEVAGWLRSLQLRGINLPDALKDEAFLIIGERRTH